MTDFFFFIVKRCFPALLFIFAAIANCSGFPNKGITIGKILTKDASTEIWRNKNESVTFNCTVLSGEPVKRIRWRRDGKAIKATQQGKRWSVLVIENIQESHAGKYKCIVRGWTKDVSYVHLHVRGPPRFLTAVASRTRGPLFILEGESIRLNCFATAEPKPIIYWEKDGKLVKSIWGTVYYYINRTNGVELNIIAPTKDQEGMYKCVVKNKFGLIHHKVRLYVRVPPPILPLNISAHQPNVTAVEGGHATLSCWVKCSPRLHVQPEWFTDTNKRISTSTKFSINETFYLDPNGEAKHIHVVNSTLTIRDVSMADAKEYTCLAWGGNSWNDISIDYIRLTVLSNAISSK